MTKEGELLPFCQTELKVGGDGEEDKIFFIWPTTIVHKINSTSPLYALSASDMLRERFEIVVILEGTILVLTTKLGSVSNVPTFIESSRESLYYVEYENCNNIQTCQDCAVNSVALNVYTNSLDRGAQDVKVE